MNLNRYRPRPPERIAKDRLWRPDDDARPTMTRNTLARLNFHHVRIPKRSLATPHTRLSLPGPGDGRELCVRVYTRELRQRRSTKW